MYNTTSHLRNLRSNRLAQPPPSHLPATSQPPPSLLPASPRTCTTPTKYAGVQLLAVVIGVAVHACHVDGLTWSGVTALGSDPERTSPQALPSSMSARLLPTNHSPVQAK